MMKKRKNKLSLILFILLVFIIILFALLLFNFKMTGKVTLPGAGVNDLNCNKIKWNLIWIEIHNKVGMLNDNSNKYDYRFLCFANQYYECGWELNYTDFAIKSQNNQIVDSWKCDLANKKLVIPEMVIDNNDPQFSTQGNWWPSTIVPGYYGSNYLSTSPGSSARAIWTINILEPGYYEIFGYWTAYSNRPKQAKYTINHGYGSTKITTNQRYHNVVWHSLGDYYYNTGTYTIELSADDGYLIADAIKLTKIEDINTVNCDVLVVGASLSGTISAIEAARYFRKVNPSSPKTVCLTEETSWVGGQVTSQALPVLDENRGEKDIQNSGIYKEMVDYVKDKYGRYAVGESWITRSSFPAQDAVDFFNQKFGEIPNLAVYTKKLPTMVFKESNKVIGAMVKDLNTGNRTIFKSKILIDGTELGDVIKLSGAEYSLGIDAKEDANETYTMKRSDVEEIKKSYVTTQAFTYIFAMENDQRNTNLIPMPVGFQEIPHLKFNSTINSRPTFCNPEGPTVNMDFWTYRRVLKDNAQWNNRADKHGISMANNQNDFLNYYNEDYIDTTYDERWRIFNQSKQRSLAYLYFIQSKMCQDISYCNPSKNFNDATCAVRGYTQIKLNTEPQYTGTNEGFAQYPYIRESRRIKPLEVIKLDDIAIWCRCDGGSIKPCYISQMNSCNIDFSRKPRIFTDSVGIGGYIIDVHSGFYSINPIWYNKGLMDPGDIAVWPYQVSLGSLIPINTDGLIASAKNIGVTHITNAAYRLHSVEGHIGQAVGLLAAMSVLSDNQPRQFYNNKTALISYQETLLQHGQPIFFEQDVLPGNPLFVPVQIIMAKGAIEWVINNSNDLVSRQSKFNFNPNQKVRRGEIARALVETFEIPINTQGGPHFVDVPASDQNYKYVETLYNNGITVGCETNLQGRRYCKDDITNKWQMAVFLNRIMNSRQFNKIPFFTDIPSTDDGFSSIQNAYQLGFIDECSENPKRFCPLEEINRGSAAKILYAALRYKLQI